MIPDSITILILMPSSSSSTRSVGRWVDGWWWWFAAGSTQTVRLPHRTSPSRVGRHIHARSRPRQTCLLCLPSLRRDATRGASCRGVHWIPPLTPRLTRAAIEHTPVLARGARREGRRVCALPSPRQRSAPRTAPCGVERTGVTPKVTKHTPEHGAAHPRRSQAR